MDVYMYLADLYCEACGSAIRADLDAAGKRPENVDDEHTYDSGDYPKGPYPDGGGASDSENYCAACGEALENPLTSEGCDRLVQDMQSALVHALEETPEYLRVQLRQAMEALSRHEVFMHLDDLQEPMQEGVAE